MFKVQDLSGMVFGKLTVIRQDGYHITYKGRPKGAKWYCSCSCGGFASVEASSLKRGSTKSCGCYRRETSKEHLKSIRYLTREATILPEGEAALNSLYTNYKYSAKKRGYEFALTKAFFKTLTQGACYYCGSPPIRVHRKSAVTNGEYIYNGVDRLDNTGGYKEGNVVSCCKHCNQAKGEQTVEEFFDHIKRMYSTTSKIIL